MEENVLLLYFLLIVRHLYIIMIFLVYFCLYIVVGFFF